MDAFLDIPKLPATSTGGNIPRPNTRLIMISGPKNREYTINELRLSTTINPNTGGNPIFYQPMRRKPYPVIVLLPISGGEFFTRHLADYFAQNGFGVLRYGNQPVTMKIEASGMAAIEEIKEKVRHYLIDIQMGLDWLLSNPGVDRKHIGLLGISEGAIVGSLVAATNRNIHAGVLILGGGNLSGIFLSSREEGLIKVRKKILETNDISIENFQQQIGSALSVIDPLTYANCIRSSTTLLIDALLDRVIHPRYANQLWKKMGRPARIRLLSGHYTTVLYLPYIRFMALRHFKKILDSPRSRSPGM